MGYFQEHHLVYAVRLAKLPSPSIAQEILASLGLESVTVEKDHRDNYYLKICICDNAELNSTKYYKEKEDVWFGTNSFGRDGEIRKICDRRLTEEERRIWDQQVEWALRDGFDRTILLDDKIYTDEERQVFFDDIPMSVESKQILMKVLESELKDYIVDHYWFDRFQHIYYGY